MLRASTRVASAALRARGGRAARGLATASFSKQLNSLVEVNDHVEVFKYMGDAGFDWTVGDCKKYTHSLLAGFHELKHKPGDKVACMLAPHKPELHCAQFVAAEAGYVIVWIDPTITDAAALKNILVTEKVKTLIYNGLEHEIELIGAVMPEYLDYEVRALVVLLFIEGEKGEEAFPKSIYEELEYYYVKVAQPFYSSKVPSMKYFITIGMDMQSASHNYCHWMAPDAIIEGIKPVPESALLQVEYTADGKKTREITHAQALSKSGTIPAISALLEKKYTVHDLGGPKIEY